MNWARPGVYLALSMLFFGRGLAGHFTTRLVGKNLGDPDAHIWFLAWLPHALAWGAQSGLHRRHLGTGRDEPQLDHMGAA